MKIVMIGIDLGKNLCSVAGLDESGAVVLRRRMKRVSVLLFTAQLGRAIHFGTHRSICGLHTLGQCARKTGKVAFAKTCWVAPPSIICLNRLCV
jgi:transposase